MNPGRRPITSKATSGRSTRGTIRGVGDQLSVALSRPQDGVLVVDVRLVTIPSPGRTAVGLDFADTVWLDPPLWEGYPPITIDASTGRSVVIGSFVP